MKAKLLLSLLTTTISLYAAQTSCGGLYFGNDAPDIINTKLTAKTKELCYKEFAVMHSGVTRTPLWSAEHLTRNMLNGRAVRNNNFHPEDRLPAEDRAELNDYARSGFDRGHMSNSADHVDAQANYETFVLSNMIPQNSDNNRGLWANIENSTRTMTKNVGETYVITGPIYIGNNIQRIGGRVLVPTKIFKAIYVPSTGQGAAYVTNNAAGESYEVISIAALTKLTGIDVFPKMSEEAKAHAMQLPAPQKNGSHSDNQPQQNWENGDEMHKIKSDFLNKIEHKIHNYNKGY